MGTRANVTVRNGDREVLFYRHSDGYPQCTYYDLEEFVRECGYDFESLVNRIQTEFPTYKIESYEAGDGEYHYYIDCGKERIECYDKWEKRYIDGDSEGHTPIW